MNSIIDLTTGAYLNEKPISVRKVSDIKTIFAEPFLGDAIDHQTVYEIYGDPGEVEGIPRLLSATTILHPGRIGQEFFMTRGHFHTNPERGEFMLALGGYGQLLLMDRDGNTNALPIQSGAIHQIDGMLAHRVVNVGSEPLIFVVVWMSDCGHDYASIEQNGFGLRIFYGRTGPEITKAHP